MNNLVSIIMPSYNSSRYISKTIDSVLSQTYERWELIIVDDASTDGSNEIIENYIKQDQGNRIKIIKLDTNSGAAISRNKAIEMASGRYISFLDADDLWKNKKLEKQLAFMELNSLVFTYSSYDLINEHGTKTGLFTTKPEIDYKEMLKTNSVGCLTAIYDTKMLGKVYMPSILKRQDYGAWLSILRSINSTKGIVESLACYRIIPGALSSNKFKAAYYQWKIYREVEKLSLFTSMYYFLNYGISGSMKYKNLKKG